MYPSRHFILSLIFSILLFPLYNYNIILIFLSAFFIDADHYLWYVLKFKNFNFRQAYNYHVESKEKDKLHIAHTVEFWILILILSFYFRFFYFILLGIIFHNILDLIYELVKQTKKNRALSIIAWLIRHSKSF